PDFAGTPANDMRRTPIHEAPFDALAVSEAAPASAVSTSRFEWMRWVRGAFISGFLLVSLSHVIYLLMGFIATRRLIRTATPLTEAAAARMKPIISELAIPGRVACVSSDAIDVPMVIGIRRPTILLPEALTRSSADPLELKHSVSHEWAHIKGHDLLT